MSSLSQWRNWFAIHLGVNQDRKLAIYLDLMRSVSLRDASYWLQVLFSAGIATLGLVMNSPAVIIGAMLISPLMGPILANGLAFATGDLVLALRAIICLNLSCLVAVAFATLLIGLMPFKQPTPEILARINPTVLDLVIALFSGFLGTIATCKDSKGVVNAIPGVAIAVALMPPLCVVGYGIGIALSLDIQEGLQAAGGSGLLLLTNMAAITFMAMLVFLLLNIDTPEVKEQVDLWHHQDVESSWLNGLLNRSPIANRWQVIGSLRNRVFLILVPILVLLIPLGQALGRLQQDFARQQRQNRIEQTAKLLWNENFGSNTQGILQSKIDTFSSSEDADKLILYMTIFTQKSYSEQEQQTFVQRFSDRLNIPKDTVDFRLTQVLMASSELFTQLAENKEPTPVSTPPPTVQTLQEQLQQSLEQSLLDVPLPPPAQRISFAAFTRSGQPLTVTLSYLSERPLGQDGQNLLTQMVQQRLRIDKATVAFEQIQPEQATLDFQPGQITFTEEQRQQLARVGEVLNRYPQLVLAVTANPNAQETAATDGTISASQRREQAIQAYFKEEWQISANRLTVITGNERATPQPSQMRLTLRLATADVATEEDNGLPPE